ncbi:MAG: PIN domain-containing protein [Propionibacteriaceae bacterium]|jgi:predicted nucleic acid-binding protein|nr:PIN domain-containing protein [Propionibacteriaceae bacterium]
MRLVADTSGIVAAINQDQADSDRFRAALAGAAQVFVTPLVLGEAHYVLTSAGSRHAADVLLTDVAEGFFELVQPTARDYGAAAELIRQYGGQLRRKRRKPGSLDLADAMNVVIAARVGVNELLTADQDYRVVKPLTSHPAFKLIPWDTAP